jgi:hypothetical protein
MKRQMAASGHGTRPSAKGEYGIANSGIKGITLSILAAAATKLRLDCGPS